MQSLQRSTEVALICHRIVLIRAISKLFVGKVYIFLSFFFFPSSLIFYLGISHFLHWFWSSWERHKRWIILCSCSRIPRIRGHASKCNFDNKKVLLNSLMHLNAVFILIIAVTSLPPKSNYSRVSTLVVTFHL